MIYSGNAMAGGHDDIQRQRDGGWTRTCALKEQSRAAKSRECRDTNH